MIFGLVSALASVSLIARGASLPRARPSNASGGAECVNHGDWVGDPDELPLITNFTRDDVVNQIQKVDDSYKAAMDLASDKNKFFQAMPSFTQSNPSVALADDSMALLEMAYCISVSRSGHPWDLLQAIEDLLAQVVQDYRQWIQKWASWLPSGHPSIQTFMHSDRLLKFCHATLGEYSQIPVGGFYSPAEDVNIIKRLEIRKLRVMSEACFLNSSTLAEAPRNDAQGAQAGEHQEAILPTIDESLQGQVALTVERVRVLYQGFLREADNLSNIRDYFVEILHEAHRALFDGWDRVLAWLTAPEQPVVPEQRALAAVISTHLLKNHLELAKMTMERLRIRHDRTGRNRGILWAQLTIISRRVNNICR